MAEDPVTEIGKYIAEEYGKEWQRKGSLETRALALATANVALATVITAWIDRLGALRYISDGIPRVIMLGATALSLVSIALSLLAAIMYTYKSPRADALKFVIEAAEGGTKNIPSVVVRAYLGQLESARSANDQKFKLIAFALACLLIASVAATATLGVVLWR